MGQSFSMGSADFMVNDEVGDRPNAASIVPQGSMGQGSMGQGSVGGAEQPLQNPEFQALVENTPDLILQIDPPATIHYANGRVSQELGIPMSNLCGKSLVHLGLPAAVLRAWQTAIREVIHSGQEQHVEFDLPTSSGAIFWYARVVPEVDGLGHIVSVLLISRDVTRLKLAELALRQSEARYRAIIEDQLELVCRFTPDGLLTFVNDACCHFFGRDRSSLLSTSILFWVLKGDRSLIQNRLMAHDLEGDPDPLEVQVMTQQGDYRWVQWTTKAILDDQDLLVEYQSVGRDIHDRKRMESALRQRAEGERTLNRLIQVIRQSLDLDTIFASATQAIAELLQVDRAAIFQYLMETEVWLGRAESCQAEGLPEIVRLQISGLHNPMTHHLKRAELVYLPSPDPQHPLISPELAARLSGQWLMVPLRVGETVWGALGLNHIDLRRPWKNSDIELTYIVADQLAIAIQQSQLYAQVQHLNASLERQVRVRTAQLQLAYEFEATLKRITDRVRDSLDETQILQTAVKELAIGMGALCCNAALFDLSKQTSTIHYEYATQLAPSQGRVSYMADFPELYEPLLQGQCFQFCSILENPVRDRTSILVCPIQDNQGVLGDLWLVSPSFHAYSEPDIRLVQQVANQCAIAIRQARLYQAAQAQVTALERLNSLKDDFLSTVSHELRTPMSNVKMAAQMLDIAMTRLGILDAATRHQHPEVDRYFRILHDECQREISLINDLLDLSRLESSTEPPNLTQVTLQDWLPALADRFIERAQTQQQTLHLHIAPNLLPLRTDPAYLERIITELLNNACKYTPSGERIILEAYANHQIRVTNTGIEIVPEERDRIFEKFYRIPQSDPWRHGGTGLGLALVKRLVEQLNGSITVTSVNQQTCFTLQFLAL